MIGRRTDQFALPQGKLPAEQLPPENVQPSAQFELQSTAAVINQASTMLPKSGSAEKRALECAHESALREQDAQLFPGLRAFDQAPEKGAK
jgi:hypothetical protein